MSELTLSEAIRIGAMLKPQGTGGFGDDGTSCALRAAMDATTIGYSKYGIDYSEQLEHWPVLARQVDPPVEMEERSVIHIIWVLNDSRRWTREAIADWVETLEPARQQDSASAQAVDAVAGDSLVNSGIPVRVAVSSSF
jgi:hypothetical protein